MSGVLDDLELNDDEERQGPRAIPARIAPPNVAGALPPANLRGLPPPTPTSGSTEDLEQRGIESHLRPTPIAKPSATEARTTSDQDELSRLEKTGSGISQVARAHPVAGGVLRGLNIAGKIGAAALPELYPVLNAIPGTEEHHNYLERQAAGRIGEDLGEQKDEATTANLSAQPELKAQANDLKQQQNENQHEKGMAELKERYRKLGLNIDEQGNISPVSYADMTPTEQAAHDLKESQANLATLRGQLEASKNDPNSPLYKQAQEKINAELERSKQAAERLGLSTAQFQNKVQEQELMKPSGQSQSRGSAAQSAMDILPQLEDEIRSNAANLGPIMGRLAKGEIAIGDVDPKIAKLYSSLSSFYALNPAVHGFRNYELVKDMPSLIGGLSRDPEGTIAGLEGLKPTLEAVAKEGKTFHKRIVQGRDTAPNAGSAPATTDTTSGKHWDPLKGEYVD